MMLGASFSLYSKEIAREWTRHIGQQGRPTLYNPSVVTEESTEQLIQAALFYKLPLDFVPALLVQCFVGFSPA